MSQAVVVGAGIGGMTSAIALRRAGWDVTVLERARALEPVGSGLAIAPNALRALDTIDLGEPVRKLARMEGRAGIRRPDGRWLVDAMPEAVLDRYGDAVVIMLRSTMVDLLAEALGEEALRLGTTVTGVDAEAGVVRTETEELRADLIVAADGIHSASRRGGELAYSGVTAWRGLVDRSALPEGPIRSQETWGRGTVFGIHELAGGLVYFYATDLAPAGVTPGDERAELLRRFGDWHDPIPALLRAADPARILRNDVYSLAKPLAAMHRGRLALVGDAAHPMTPNLGQGACQAIEDAVVLAHHADDLPAYTAARLARTSDIVRKSRTICRVTKLRNPLAVRLRDTGIALATRLSSDLMLRSVEPVVSWRPPAWSGREPAGPA